MYGSTTNNNPSRRIKADCVLYLVRYEYPFLSSLLSLYHSSITHHSIPFLFLKARQRHHYCYYYFIIMGVCDEMVDKVSGLNTPKVERGAEVCLGITNFFLWGIGTMIGGFMANDMADVLIGLIQLFIPCVGWIWSIIWGVLMVFGKNSES
jgi:hypothetical protein